MVDFKNHRRFLLRWLSTDIIPVSIRLKSNIKLPKGFNIIKRTEKALLNERIRMFNNTITMLEKEIDTCMNELYNTLDEEFMEECMIFIKTRKESRHIKTQIRQVNKFNQLCQKIEVAPQANNMVAMMDMHQNSNKQQVKQLRIHEQHLPLLKMHSPLSKQPNLEKIGSLTSPVDPYPQCKRDFWPGGQILQLYQETPHWRMYYRGWEGLPKVWTEGSRWTQRKN